jgi:hypothetical protein
VVRQRLAVRHGEHAHVSVTAAPGEGWVVAIEIPAVVSRAPRAPSPVHPRLQPR